MNQKQSGADRDGAPTDAKATHVGKLPVARIAQRNATYTIRAIHYLMPHETLEMLCVRCSRCKVEWLFRCGEPLGNSQIRIACHSHPTITPIAVRYPLNEVMAVSAFRSTENDDVSFRIARTSGIRVDYRKS